MRRRLFIFCSAASLVALIGICALWVRSYRYVDQFYQRSAEEGFTGRSLELDRGVIVYLQHYNIEGEAFSSFNSHRREPELLWTLDDIDSTERFAQNPDYLSLRWCGFRLGRGASAMGMMKWATVPFWLPAVLAAVMPLLLLKRVRLHRHRISQGLCLQCGYDLRATTEKCPECGAGGSGRTPAA